MIILDNNAGLKELCMNIENKIDILGILKKDILFFTKENEKTLEDIGRKKNAISLEIYGNTEYKNNDQREIAIKDKCYADTDLSNLFAILKTNNYLIKEKEIELEKETEILKMYKAILGGRL